MPIVQNIMVEDADLPTTLPCIIDGLGQPSGYSPVFSPPDIAGLRLWLRADMGITLATGVSQWNDQSGTGDPNKNATQASGGAQPTLNTADAAYNNQPTLTFTGASSQYMQTGTWIAPPATPCTWIVVGNYSGGGSGGPSFIDALTVTNARIYTNNVGTTINIASGSSLTGNATVTNQSIIAGVFNGNTASAIYVNNTQLAVVVGAAGNLSTPTGLTIGAREDVTNFFYGKIAEVIGYTGVLTQPQLALVFTYLGNRYAIPVVV